jgi:CRISPR-associated protein Csb1
MILTFEQLRGAVENEAAIRRVRRLQPAGGSGDMVFPPTYPSEERNAPAQHVFETRRIDGQDRQCVLIDSVQSQANRMEEALLGVVRTGQVPMPYVTVDFSGTEIADIGEITSLDAPHRVFDAILRDSELGGQPFMKSDVGRRLAAAKARNALALLEVSPSALVFGAWNSTGEGGGLGAKFPRCIVSEIVGVGAAQGKRTGSRVDPLGVRREVEVYELPGGDWTLNESEAGKKAKKLRPSEVNHGNIRPSVVEQGVTFDYALHTVVLSLAGLRRLSFPQDAGKSDPARDTTARCLLAALGLQAIAAQERMGYALRSRCDLVPDTSPDVPGNAMGRFELVRADGSVEPFELTADAANTLAKECIRAAEKVGVRWSGEPVRLKPQTKLVQLVKQSREKALAGEPQTETD